MRIVLDLQGVQTESRFRGIGRYTLSLAQAIARNRGAHEIIIALNGLFQDTVDPVRAAFDGLLPKENICVWRVPGPVREFESGLEWRRDVAERIREVFLAGLQPDIVHVSSLFEGYVDDAVTSVGIVDRQTPTVVTLYDLIPLLNPAAYLKNNPMYERYYKRKIEFLKRADQWHAISESAAREGIEVLNLPADRVVNISGACDSVFRRCELSDMERRKLLTRYGISRSFILYAGGADARKNLTMLIRAYARLPESLRNAYLLVLAGNMPDGEVSKLRRDASSAGLSKKQLLFTGYVGDEELVRLYNLCTVFVLPSHHEGFGMPALEAMSCGAAVIGANTTSIPEVVGRQDALFDPFDENAIMKKLAQVVSDEAFRKELAAYGTEQAKKFSWDKSAKVVIDAYERLHEQRAVSKTGGWAGIAAERKNQYGELIDAIADVAGNPATVDDKQLMVTAACIAGNEQVIDRIVRARSLPGKITWRIEGPFDSSYSLALVNRETARALAGSGHTVVLHSTEGPGDFPASEKFLADNPDLAAMHGRAARVTQFESDVTSRNLYPPRVTDMHGRCNFLHAYGWEESAFPYEWVESFNDSLQGITVMSEHVRKVMIDNGVTVPMAVSGLGVDHWESVTPDTRFVLNAGKFRFLHVSSCFPRKGADILLEAYGRAFSAADDVSLIIKTFPNPHNEIHRWLEEAREKNPGLPDVRILEDDFSDGELKALYGQCHVLVAPSRAEGFGLPMAEAMLSGLAVITTGWSGQVDFCTPETAWLVDYSFERAKTHFGLPDSVWATPDVGHLAQVMREVYETPGKIRDLRISAGRGLLMKRFRWSHAADRMVQAARTWACMPELPEPRIGWVTTWNTLCGIASYSEHLVNSMPSRVTIMAAHAPAATIEDQPYVERCWAAGDHDSLIDLKRSVERNRVDTLVVQFNYGFFDLQTLADFLIEQIDAGRVVIVMMHATSDPAHVPHKKLSVLVPALSRCHRVLVHTPGDMNRLKTHGLVDNVAVFPHGIPYFSPPVERTAPGERAFTVASYGFFLPHKGLLELIDAIALLRGSGIRIRLHMVNAEYPVPESRQIIDLAKRKVSEQGLEDAVIFSTGYLTDMESLTRLSDADLIVYPYQDTGESSSAAVRYGLASGRPVAVTPLAIFDDVAPAVFSLPGCTPADIAEGIKRLLDEIANGTAAVKDKQEEAKRWCEAHHHTRLGQRLYGMLRALAT